MEYFTVKGWENFQHYKDRNPPWIKLATDTFQNYEFSKMQDASKLLAVCIWTLAARGKDGKVPFDFEYIKGQCLLGSMVKECHLKELIDQGYLIPDSDPLAECKQSACLEGEAYSEETEGDIEPPIIPPLSFESLWDRFPKQRIGNQDKAQSAYKSALTRDTKEAIHAGLDAYCRSDEVSRGFAKGAAAWLNDDRWKHDYSIQSKPGGASRTDTALAGIFAAGNRNGTPQPVEPGEGAGGGERLPSGFGSGAGAIEDQTRVRQ